MGTWCTWHHRRTVFGSVPVWNWLYECFQVTYLASMLALESTGQSWLGVKFFMIPCVLGLCLFRTEATPSMIKTTDDLTRRVQSEEKNRPQQSNSKHYGSWTQRGVLVFGDANTCGLAENGFCRRANVRPYSLSHRVLTSRRWGTIEIIRSYLSL